MVWWSVTAPDQKIDADLLAGVEREPFASLHC